MSGSFIPCVGAVITDEHGRLLLIKRGHEPGAGLWSLPGGRIEPGETDTEALVREVREETGLEVEPGRLLGAVRRPGNDGDVIDIRDYAVTVIGGTLTPGDDAADARWVSAPDLDFLAITEGLVEALTSWGVLGRRRHLSSYFCALCLGEPLVLSHGLTAHIPIIPRLYRVRRWRDSPPASRWPRTARTACATPRRSSRRGERGPHGPSRGRAPRPVDDC